MNIHTEFNRNAAFTETAGKIKKSLDKIPGEKDEEKKKKSLAAIFKPIKTFFVKNSDEYIMLSVDDIDNRNKIYNFYKNVDGRKKVSDVNDDLQMAGILVDIIMNENISLYKVKNTEISSNVSSPSIASVIPATIIAKASEKSNLLSSLTITKAKINHPTEPMDYITTFSSLNINIPSAYIKYTNGTASIVKNINESTFNKSSFTACPYHSHQKSFAPAGREYNTIYGYILPTGMVYDICSTLNKTKTIPDSIFADIDNIDKVLSDFFGGISTLIKDISNLINQKQSLRDEISNLDRSISRNTINFRLKTGGDDILTHIYTDVSNTSSSLSNKIKSDQDKELCKNLILGVTHHTYNYSGTELLNTTNDFLNSYNNIFVQTRNSISIKLINQIYREIFTDGTDILSEINFNSFFPYIEERINNLIKQKDIMRSELDFIINSDLYANRFLSIRGYKNYDPIDNDQYDILVKEITLILTAQNISSDKINELINMKPSQGADFITDLNEIKDDIINIISNNIEQFDVNVLEQYSIFHLVPFDTNLTYSEWYNNFVDLLIKNKIYLSKLESSVIPYLDEKDNTNIITNIEALHGRRIGQLSLLKEQSDKRTIINQETIKFNDSKRKLVNLNKKFDEKIGEIKNSFTSILPIITIFSDKLKSNKIPFRSNSNVNGNINLQINNWIEKSTFIVGELSALKIPEIERLLSIYNKTDVFYELRKKIYFSFRQNNYDFGLDKFNQIFKRILNNLDIVDIDYFIGIIPTSKYPVINNDVLNILERYNIIPKDLNRSESNLIRQQLLKRIGNDKNNKDYLKMVEIFSEEIGIIDIINTVKDDILPFIRNKILTAPIPDLNTINIYVPFSFSFEVNKVSLQTRDIMFSYEKIMGSILEIIEKSYTLINKGPGMHFLYNSVLFFTNSIMESYNENSLSFNNDYSNSIPFDENILSEWNLFLSLITVKGKQNENIIDKLISDPQFDNFASLLSGSLSSEDFQNNTIKIKNFISPYETSNYLTNSFVKTTFKVLSNFFNRGVINHSLLYRDLLYLLIEYNNVSSPPLNVQDLSNLLLIVDSINSFNTFLNDSYSNDILDLENNLFNLISQLDQLNTIDQDDQDDPMINQIMLDIEEYGYQIEILEEIEKREKMKLSINIDDKIIYEFLINIVNGLMPLLQNINLFIDEYRDKNKNIIPYDVYFEHKNEYEFDGDKKYLEIMIIYFESLFQNLIQIDQTVFATDVIKDIKFYFRLFSKDLENNINIEKEVVNY